MKISVAMIEPVGGHGGMNYYDFNICRELNVQKELEVQLYTSNETITTGQQLNFEVHKPFVDIYGKRNKFLRGINYLKGLKKSLSKVKNKKTQIVHYHFFQYTYLELINVLAAKALNKKIVVTAHDIESFAEKNNSRIARFIYKNVDHIIAHNNVSKTELQNKLRIEENKITIIPHGDYLEQVKIKNRGEALAKLNINSDSFNILFFGQIKEVKGLELLIHAANLINNKNIKYIVAGKTWKDDMEKYKSLIRNYDLDKNFIIHNHYIPDELVDNYFNSADLIILPYKKIYQSGVLLNAMSYKKPVLVSNLQGMTEIITDNYNGIIFESNNYKDLADKLQSITNNKYDLALLGQNAYTYLVKNHSWEQIAIKTKAVYANLLTKGKN